MPLPRLSRPPSRAGALHAPLYSKWGGRHAPSSIVCDGAQSTPKVPHRVNSNSISGKPSIGRTSPPSGELHGTKPGILVSSPGGPEGGRPVARSGAPLGDKSVPQWRPTATAAPPPPPPHTPRPAPTTRCVQRTSSVGCLPLHWWPLLAQRGAPPPPPPPPWIWKTSCRRYCP